MNLKQVLWASWNAYALLTIIMLLLFYGHYTISFMASVLMPPLLIGSVIVQTIYIFTSHERKLINYLLLIISIALLVSLTTGYLTSLNTIIVLAGTIALFNAQHILTRQLPLTQ